MKLLAALACASLLAACHSVRPCADGTVFLDLSFGTLASGADHLDVDATVGNQSWRTQVAYAGQPSGSLALDFPSGYPAGQPITLVVTAARGGDELARGFVAATLSDGCAHLAVALGGVDGGALGTSGVAVAGTSKAAQPGTSTLSASIPATAQSRDFLVLCIYADSSQVTAQLPAGWAPLDELLSPQGFHVWWLTRTAGSSTPGATVSFSGGTPTAEMAIVAYRNVSTPHPVDAMSQPATLPGMPSGNVMQFTAPSVGPLRPGDRLATFYVYDGGDGGSWTQAPAGMTKLVDVGAIALFDAPVLDGGAGAAETAGAALITNSNYGTSLAVAVATQ
jgi:hypothetical protein